ncbi:MAG: uroporphyrinogen-III C-methyltransferase [Mobilicoccus sp.]|nr:uroporphyrinogen-III C-methyltransferase [Mobilicoccus sp.]
MSDARPEPVEVLLAGHDALVVGGLGPAIGPVGRLLRAGARVHIVAPALEAALEDLVDRDLVTWRAREYEAGDLNDVSVVVAATGSSDTDATVLRDAAAARVMPLAPRAEDRSPADLGAPVEQARTGSVVLVGGGPGAPGLITVAGREAVLGADVVVVDRLAPIALLDELGPQVEVVDVSKIPRGRFTPQERINEVLVDRALAGKRVARLKGGDPFVFGRGMEEQIACEDAGVPVEVIPGVTSAVSAPALAGIPVTHRGVVQGFAVVSGHAAPDDPRSTVDWAALGASGMSIVVLMGVETLPRIAAALLASGRAGDTPVACVMDAALPSQRSWAGTLSALTEGTPDEVAAPAVTVIGDVARFAANLTV